MATNPLGKSGQIPLKDFWKFMRFWVRMENLLGCKLHIDEVLEWEKKLKEQPREDSTPEVRRRTVGSNWDDS